VNPAEFVGKYGQPKEVHDDWSKNKRLTQQEIGQTLKERWNIQPTRIASHAIDEGLTTRFCSGGL